MKNNIAGIALILGGAGFIGSSVAKKFYDAGYKVIVIDGLLEHTGGRLDNIRNLVSKVQFVGSKIEDVKNLDEIVKASKIIIDCMSWSSHRLAIANPLYDLKLNVESHLYLIEALKKYSDKKVIYLGTRGQYGNPNTFEILENTPMVPEDIQGIHKLTAETYYRIYSNLNGLDVISLRFPNCFGENQPVKGNDIGLIGGFIRDLIHNKTIKIFGENRKRNLLYVNDLAEIIFQLSQKQNRGFSAFNLKGYEETLDDLVGILVALTGCGSYEKAEMPFEIKAIDIGGAKFNDLKLREYLGDVVLTDLRASLANTVRYFKEEINDLAV